MVKKKRKNTKASAKMAARHRLYEKTGLSRETKARCHYETIMIDGKSRDVLRASDGLWQMYRRHTITEDEYKAGRAFQNQFAIAGYDRIKTTNLIGASGGGMSVEDQFARTYSARGYCARIMDLLGGGESPIWLAVYWYVGHDKGLRGVADAMQKQDGSPPDSANTVAGFVRSGIYLMGKDYVSMNKTHSQRRVRPIRVAPTKNDA